MNSGWIIEEQCPQCGAPVTLKETDRLFSCTFCRVKLYIMSSGFFRYCIPPPEDLEEEIVYAPYWRFRGMSFSLSQQGLKHRVIDTSFPATGYDFLPPSLGLRPQTQKLKFMSPEIKGKFLKQKIPFKQIFSNIKAEEKTSAEQIENPSVFLQSFIGETTSLIYAPFYLKDYRFHDAILKSPVQTESDNKPRSVPLEKTQNWNRSFQPTLCPLCGWDLNGEKESCILICNNCHSAWKASPSGFKKVRFEVIQIQGDNILYVPFWKMQTNVDELQLHTYADLARFANIPKAANRAWEKEKLYFWSPAFKVAPKLFLRLSKQLTLSHFMEKGQNKPEKTELHFFPVTLPAAEAAQSIRITLARLVTHKKNVYPMLPDLKINVRGSSLIYLPFIVRTNEVVQHHLKFSINKNALKFGKNI